MRAPWVGFGCLILMVALLAGCKTPPPQLKPAAAPEVLAGPPIGDSRYDRPDYPKEALTFSTSNDPRKIGNNNGPMGPSFGGPNGMGGMGGMGGMAGR
jgi:hypothetical protein